MMMMNTSSPSVSLSCARLSSLLLFSAVLPRQGKRERRKASNRTDIHNATTPFARSDIVVITTYCYYNYHNY